MDAIVGFRFSPGYRRLSEKGTEAEDAFAIGTEEVKVAEKEEVEAGTSSHRFSPVGSPSVMGSKWRKGKGKRRTLLEGELP